MSPTKTLRFGSLTSTQLGFSGIATHSSCLSFRHRAKVLSFDIVRTSLGFCKKMERITLVLWASITYSGTGGFLFFFFFSSLSGKL